MKSYISAMVIKSKTTRLAVGDTVQSKELGEGESTSKFEADELNSWRALERAWEAKPIQTGAVDRNLERLQIPKFDGDKSKFAGFWAAFSAIVDETKALPKYKMLRLKACLEGKAVETIEKLGYSDEAYEEAKKTLIRKFGAIVDSYRRS